MTDLERLLHSAAYVMANAIYRWMKQLDHELRDHGESDQGALVYPGRSEFVIIRVEKPGRFWPADVVC